MILTIEKSIESLLKTAENVAASRATVLITGESGTGKELLARYIHSKSNRASRRMVAINCAAVPENLLESELFGYERGAFTGATATKQGKFEIANNSTLLLDELGEMPLHLQAKLLRVLQEGELERLGSNTPQKINVRVIAATNRNLETMVHERRFREDLFYRLNVIPLCIPPLRERLNDLQMLAQHFVEVACLNNSRPLKTISSEAMARIITWTWPGNIRELENSMERTVLCSESNTIGVDDIHLPIAAREVPSELRPGMTVESVERQLILATLDFTGQNRTEAARLLGISIRTLRNKINEYRMNGADIPTLSPGRGDLVLSREVGA